MKKLTKKEERWNLLKDARDLSDYIGDDDISELIDHILRVLNNRALKDLGRKQGITKGSLRSSPKSYRFHDNPEEERFYNSIIDQFDHSSNSLITRVSYILYGTDDLMGNKAKQVAFEEEIQAFLLTIQWLGSPVGQSFLRSMGYEKTENNSDNTHL